MSTAGLQSCAVIYLIYIASYAYVLLPAKQLKQLSYHEKCICRVQRIGIWVKPIGQGLAVALAALVCCCLLAWPLTTSLLSESAG